MIGIIAFINAFLATCLKPAIEALVKCRFLQGMLLATFLLCMGSFHALVPGIIVAWIWYVCTHDKELFTKFREKYNEYRGPTESDDP